MAMAGESRTRRQERRAQVQDAPKRRKKAYEEAADGYGEHAPTLHDLMTVADGLEVTPTELYVSPGGWTRVYYVTALPQTIPFGYLHRFFTLGADVAVSLHVEPADSARAMAKRTKMMARIHSEILQEQKWGTNKNVPFFQEQYELLEQERERLRLGLERLFYVTIVFAVSSRDRAELEAACDKIEREGFAGFLIRSAYKEHDLGFRAVAPIGVNALRHPIEMTARALANAFPFSNSHFSHEYGVPIGTDFSTGHFNRYDAWHERLPNANMVVIGASGAGKSYFVKGLVARSAAFGIRHVLVDYEGEYTNVVRALGGVSIRIDERSPARLNPFELEEEEEALADGAVRRFVDVKEKIAEMERLVLSMAHLHSDERLDAYAVAAINDILQTLYETTFGFTPDPASLYEPVRYERDARGERIVLQQKRPQPRFRDFFAALSERAQTDTRLEPVVMRLRRFAEGGTEGIFDCDSNVDLKDNPIVHFDLSSLSDKSMARKLGMQVVLEWTIEKFVKKNARTKKRVVIDEAQKMLEHPDHAQFIEDVFRRIRKRSGSAVAATQDFRVFAEDPHGRAIVQNSATKVLMRQDKNDKRTIQDVFGLEEHEFAELAGYLKGQSRWVAGDEIFYNQLVPFAYEHELFTTRYVTSEQEWARGRRQE